MKKVSKNQLGEGMFLDVHASGQRPTTTRKTKNFRLITRDNNTFVLSKIKGNKQRGQLNTGYVPLAIDDVNGVAYIISAEVVNGVATGKGEVGVFPSPNYEAGSTGTFQNQYRALQNFGGDDGAYPDLNGPFRSVGFNFDLEHTVDIELQHDYDGTTNIIFTDGKSPMRVINSGFVTLPGGKFQIIDRSGSKDSNRYTLANFENTIQLIARSAKIMNVAFNSCDTGGRLPAGDIQYLFAYATADGNETEIIAQSFSVPVFNGDRIANIDGGKNTGDLTNKLNRFTLSNLDDSYASVAVYFVISQGMLSEVRSAYRINQVFNITGNTMDFIHTGFEDLIQVPVSDLIVSASTIDTAETLTQADGYLVAANIREKVYDVESLRKFARLTKLGHKQVTLDLIGPEEGFGRLYNEPLNQTDPKPGTDGYNGGYANPKNVYEFTGHWGGEAYPYMMSFLFNDGTESPLFPCLGVDNVNNTNLAALEALTLDQANALDTTGGFSTDGKMLNNKGIYRFPNRNAAGQNKLMAISAGEGRITVNGITFKIPSLDTDLGGGKKIKDITIGVRFHRGERREDVLLQGTMIDCIMVPDIDQDHAGTDEKLWNFGGDSGYNEDNCKLVPAYGHILETADVWESHDNPLKRSGSDRYRFGIEAFQFNVNRRDPWQKLAQADYKSPFAMVSTDVIVNPGEFVGVSRRDTRTKLLYRQIHKASIRTPSAGQTTGAGDHFSVLALKDMNNNLPGITSYPSKASYTTDSLDVKNALKFSAVARFQCRRNNKPDYYLFRNKYNSFMGLRLDSTSLRASEPNDVNNEGGDMVLSMLSQEYNYSFLANVYNGGDQRTSTAVSQVYQNIDNIRYFPISGKMYWDNLVDGADASNTLEGRLDGSRKITLFGGDCFISHTFRKLYNNAELSDSEFVDKNAPIRTGYTLSLVNEGNFNASLRSFETRDVVEGERKHPAAYTSYNPPAGDAGGKGNVWRDYKLFESAGYNKGFSMTDGNVTYVTLPLNTPYIQTIWRTRVWTSAKHVSNSFENGYRRFFERNYKDYPSSYGQITKLMYNNKRLFCIQENAIGTIIIDEKVQTAQASGGAITMSTGSRLSDLEPLSTEVGSRHKSSVFASDNGVYGVMLDRGIIWGAIGDGLGSISDLCIRSFLDEQYTSQPTEAIKELTHNVVGAWDKGNKEVLFTFYKKGEGVSADKSFTVAMSEVTKKIHSFYTFIPMRYFNLREELYSFSSDDASRIWQHNSSEVPYGNFYGVQHEALVTVVLNPEANDNKEFQNLLIESNRVMPKSIVYRVQGAKTSHDLSYALNQIRTNNCKYVGERWEVTIPKVNNVHHQDAEQKIPQEKAGARSLLQVGSRLKSGFAIVEITYDSGDAVEIKQVGTIYKSMV